MRPAVPSTDEQRLRRELGLWTGVLVVVNATIGTGIFKTPAKVARLAGDLDVYLLLWVAGGVIALCGALSLAELAAAIPRTGGLYEYLRRAYGRPAAFLFGWTTLVLLIPSAVGGFGRLAAEAISSLIGLGHDRDRESALAAGLILCCTLANLAGVRTSALTQSAVAAAKYAGVLALAAVGLLLGGVAGEVPVPADLPPMLGEPTVAGAFAGLVSVMWAYDGWADLTRVAGEVKDPHRTLPRALAVGSVAIIAIYLLANAGYVRALGLDGLRHSTTGANMPAANLARLTLGGVGVQALSALILVSCLGACLTSLFTAPRVFVPLASDGLFPAAVGAVSPRTGVPARAVLTAGLLGAGYVAFRSFEQLTEAFVVGYFPFYMLAVAAVFRLRRRAPDLVRPFRVPLYPVVPAVFLAGATCLLAGAIVDADRAAWFSFGVMLLGLPAGWAWQKLSRRRGG